MSWRGQGGKRARGRRGGQDPELDSTAWLAELEREAAQAGDEDEDDDWANTLRGRRSPGPPPPAPPAPPAAERHDWAPPAPPPAEPGWPAPPDPSAAPHDHGGYGAEPAGVGSSAWSTEPAPQDPSPPPEPDWSSWHQPAPDAFEPPAGPASTDAYEPPRGPVSADPFDATPAPQGPGQDWGGSRERGDQGWQSAGVDTPTGAWSPGEPVGREPDYPALFGELYRRRTSEQDSVWEPPPAAEPLPDHGQPEPPSGGWPYEETTGSWEPSDRSFVWPADELPSTQAEWDQPAPQSWLDDPNPSLAPTPPPAEAMDQTATWPAPSPRDWADPDPAPRPSPWAGAGNGTSPAGPVLPPASPPAGPPPADWAAAIPTDIPAARRAADPGAATRAWRPDEAVEAEPGVPLGADAGGTRMARPAPLPEDEEPYEVRRKAPAEDRRKRPAGERQARAWPRIVAVVSWIVLLMVVCWFYVFPWLERVLPENF
jgi:hypothetical protein